MWCSTAWSCLKNQKGFDNLNLQPTGDITIPEYEFAENMIDPPTPNPQGGVGGTLDTTLGGGTPDPYVYIYIMTLICSKGKEIKDFPKEQTQALT